MEIYSVKQLNTVIRSTLANEIGVLAVRGEVHECKTARQRLVYFRLKEDDTSILCFMLSFELPYYIENGMEVVVTATPTLFARTSDLYLRVHHIELVGEGALRRSFELLKQKLEKEGLFVPSRKRSIPLYPKRLGLITSRDSAAIGDFLRGLRDRWGGVEIFFVDVPVQGAQAVSSIVRAFEYFQEWQGQLDVIVLMRGGGSIEDLQPFNSEEVARAIFRCKFPVVVGVGHERDETIVDLVADLRASTPTKAAELIFPHRLEVERTVDMLLEGLEVTFHELIHQKAFILEESELELQKFFTQRLRYFQGLLFRVYQAGETLRQWVHKRFFRIHQLLRAIETKEVALLHTVQRQVGTSDVLITQLSPKATLKRGYAIVQKKGFNGVITDVKLLRTAEEVVVTLSKGKFESEVKKVVASNESLTARN